MNKKKIIFSVIISLLMVSVLVLCIVLATQNYLSDSNGVLTIEVVDVDGNMVKSKEIEFNEGDKLRDLLSNNFDNFKIEESEYGAYIVSIESIVQEYDAKIYIALYIDNEYAQTGIDTLKFTNGSVITFKAEIW